MLQRSQRKTLTYYPTVKNAATGEVFGYLIDLSPDGMKMLSDKEIEVEKYYRLTIDVKSDRASDRELAVEAKSAWCRPDVNPDFYATGFAFKNLTPAADKIIARLMREYQFQG